MANPGYPQMGNPMGNPMMGGPPQQMQPMRPPPQMRRGTPKAVPVLVSAGLAIGVFCGLLFGVGTGESEAKAGAPEEKKFVGTKIDGADDTTATAGGVGPAPPKSVTDGSLVTGTIKQPKAGSGNVAAGSGSAGSGSAAAGSAATVAPAAKSSKVTFTLKPDSVKDAKITVDGIEVANNTIEIPLGDQTKKEVAVVVKAPGFKDFEQKLEVDEGEMKVEYPLTKERKSSGVATPKRPDPPGGKGGKKPKKTSGGGLIDI
jgi:hypothetical protein